MTYSASLDTLNKVATIAIVTLLAVVGGSALYATFTQPFPAEAHAAFPFVLLLVIAALVIAYGFHPQSYSLSNGTLTIHRPFKTAVYSLADIAEVRQLASGAWTGGFRVFGVGGFFGFYGKFWIGKLGTYTAYGTRSNNKIFITFKNGSKILITPDSLELLNELKGKINK